MSENDLVFSLDEMIEANGNLTDFGSSRVNSHETQTQSKVVEMPFMSLQTKHRWEHVAESSSEKWFFLLVKTQIYFP